MSQVSVTRKSIIIITIPMLFACGTPTPPPELLATEVFMAPCTVLTECVSSDASNTNHYVEPFKLAMSQSQAWPIIRAVVSSSADAIIVRETPDYIRTEIHGGMFGSFDELELQYRPDEGHIAVRYSANKYSERGASRVKVEEIRAFLSERGVLE